VLALLRILLLRQLLIAPVGNHAGPLRFIGDFVGLDANLGIRAHPLDFLAEGGKDLNVAVLDCNENGDDVRLAAL
jgi:hypothetical protein